MDLVRSAMRFFVGHALANHAANGVPRPFRVGDFQHGTLVVSEVKFRQISLQMLWTDVVVRSHDPALENSKIAFHGIGVRLSANVFARTVIDDFMAKVAVHVPILPGIVRHQIGLAFQLFNQDRTQRSDAHASLQIAPIETAVL